MQRHPSLHKLSSEHHMGLVIARRARKAAANDDARVLAEAWAEVGQRFERELEPHFRSEEEHLLPAMLAAGEAALVARTLQEHKTMRRMVAEDRSEHLSDFAALLQAHIRFEEKELFETAQRVLPPDLLDGLF